MTVLPEFVRVLYVAVTDYTNLELRKNFKESDVVALAEHTDLVSWMKGDNESHKIRSSHCHCPPGTDRRTQQKFQTVLCGVG